MINRTVLVGRLTKDPELKYTQSGIAVCRFTLAVNRPFKSEDGQQQADFIQIVAWRKQAENVANYLHKGSLAGVDGRIQTGSFEGQDGKRVYTTEVVADSVQFLEPRNSSENANSSLPPDLNNPGKYTTQNNAQNAAQGAQGYGGANTPPSNYSAQGGYGGQAQGYNQPQGYGNWQPGGGQVEVTDDDLPF